MFDFQLARSHLCWLQHPSKIQFQYFPQSRAERHLSNVQHHNDCLERMIRQWIIVTYHHWWWCRSPWVHSRRNKRETETDTWVSQIVRFQRFVQLHSPINRNKASLQSSAEAGAEECFEKVTTETKTCVKCKIFSSQDSSVLFFSILLSFFSSPLQQLPVITSNTIVRCRSCRTYINPFVTFLDQRRWKCNLCYRVNDGMWHYWSCVQSCKFIIIASFCVSCVSSFFVFLVQFQMSSCTTPSPGRTASPIRDQRSRTPPWSSSPPQTTWWAASSVLKAQVAFMWLFVL